MATSSRSFFCFNCGQRNDHYSRDCSNQPQQFSRCPSCNSVVKTPGGHKPHCTHTDFISIKIGEYELPLLEYNVLRIKFKNIDQILCAQPTINGVMNFHITKFFSSENIRLRRVYEESGDTILDIKYKPTINISIGRLNEQNIMCSLYLCEDNFRMNHYYHINKNGNVTYNLSSSLRKDNNHDIDLKLLSKNKVILSTLYWKKTEANVAMNEAAVSIHGQKILISALN